MLVNCSCWAVPLSKSARVLRRSSGRRREPRCSALKGGFRCKLGAMVKADGIRLSLRVSFKRKPGERGRLAYSGIEEELEEGMIVEYGSHVGRLQATQRRCCLGWRSGIDIGMDCRCDDVTMSSRRPGSC